MKAQDFKDWQEIAKAHKAIDMVRLLDISRNHAQLMVKAAKAGEDVKIKRTVALAMTAIAQGLKPWGDKETT